VLKPACICLVRIVPPTMAALFCCATTSTRKLFLWLLLLLAATISHQQAAAAAAASDKQECVVQEDGSCLNDDEVVVDIPALPPVEDGHLDTGFGEKQQMVATHEEAIMERIRKMQHYMYGEVLRVDENTNDEQQAVAPAVPKDVLASECLLRNAQCAYWAAIGECEANPAYMTLQCAPVCLSCHQLSFETRCPVTDLKQPDIWQPGDLNRMFERILLMGNNNASTDDNNNKEESNYKPQMILKPGMQVKGGQDAPWVVIVDDFLTADECDTLIRLGGEQGYERSKDVGQKKFDGTYDSHLSEGRTSSNAWCLDACYEHEVTKRILDKIANLTGIPDTHNEYLQLLQYHENQFYEVRAELIVLCFVLDPLDCFSTTSKMPASFLLFLFDSNIMIISNFISIERREFE